MSDYARNTPDGPIRQVPYLSVSIRVSEGVTEGTLSRVRAGLSDASGMVSTRINAVESDAPAAGDDINATIELTPGTGINSPMFDMSRYRDEFAGDPDIEVTGVFINSGDPDEALLASQHGGNRL